MTLEEVQKDINQTKNELAKVPQIEARLHRLLGMEELLLLQQKKEHKPELKVGNIN